MPRDLSPYLDPTTTALVTLEVQENLLLPEHAMIPGLAAHAQEIGLIDRLGVLFDAARRVGTRIFYVTDGRGNDGSSGAAAAGGAGTATVGRAIRTDRARRAGHGPIVAALTPHPEDVAISRHHGMTGFYSTPLDAYLRGLGMKTVIVTGVSANIAVNGTAIEAMNRGYRVIVPSDCVAGDPPAYVEQLLRFTLRNVALVAPVQGILDHWAGLPDDPITSHALR
ncbi:MAG TPA: cysteine hydrolase [Acidimicrobiia bacterium]|nr:cysteine hydrolase [Acidimicrobiia bacterium]